MQGAASPRRIISRIVVCLMFLLFAVCSQAQTELGTVRGIAQDASGAIVPGAAVTLTNQETNAAKSVTSNTDGAFEFPFLPVGTYRLEVKAQGFESYVARDILIRAREVRRIDASLTVGATTSEVTVEVGAATIATEGGYIAAGFSNKQFVDSPMSQQTFFPQRFMTTLPFVQSQNGNVNLRFAGQAPSQIAQNMDGIPNDGANNLTQNMNDFEDLQVVPVLNGAEFSRIGEFSMVSRRGSNQFHGRITYDLTNSFLNARSYFNPGKKPPYKEHRGVANFSGPIIKDKLFFYGAYNLDRIPSASYYTRVVPTTAFRNGDFSALATPLKNPFTGGTYAGNQLTGINATSLKIQNTYIPEPNTSVTGANYQFQHPFPTDLLKWDGFHTRIDWKSNPNNLVFGRFINRLTPYVLAGAFKGLGTWTRMRNSSQLMVNDTWTMSPRLVTSVEFGWTRDIIRDGDTISGVTPTNAADAISTIGLQGVNPQNFNVMGFPTMAITGYQTLSEPVGGLNQNRNDLFYSVISTYAKGKHVIKGGAQLRTFRDHPQAIPTDVFGSFTFNGSFTGNAYADFLLGLPFTSQRNQNALTNRTSTAYELGVFLADTFKVSPKLTLDYGLRWETFSPANYKDGLQYNYDPATGNVIIPTIGIPFKSSLYNSNINVVAGNPYTKADLWNFRPRVGVSYRLNGKTFVRGGIGSYTEALGNLYRLQGTGPFAVSQTYTNTFASGVPQFTFPNPFPATGTGAAVPSQSVIGYPSRTDQGTILQYTASVERELGNRFGLRISYAGSRSMGMNYLLETNKPKAQTKVFAASDRPRAQFVSTQVYMNDGNAKYDAGNIMINRRTTHTIVEAHYTFAQSTYDYGNLQDPYNHYQWNKDAYNSRHRFVLSTSYDLPFGRGRSFGSKAPGWVDAVIGGWQTTFVQFLQSGQYFTPTFSGSDPSGTNTSGGIPDRIGNGNLARGQRSASRYFDTTAFVCPGGSYNSNGTMVCPATPIGRYGNSGVNIIEGPGWHVSHLSALKKWKIYDRLTTTFQANVSNLFNSPHWDFPYANVSVTSGASQAGKVYQIKDAASNALGGQENAGPRQVSFRLRVEF